ncbi:unnamed protein product [Rotaria sordida]|uniref:Peptidase S1 domain-containing protein n=1 Tax=Rotaria sordida TaxID=392033 RepID=A0A818XX74_9BILA|nr:unnamed protein product [Rotaria sordida]CAF1027020.1 unnamed protein product [Rotaria sordida]CAF3745552.1 unnamed protein product [Rotaria sordida]
MMRLLIFFFIVFICEKGSGTIYQCNTNASCGCSTSSTLLTRIVGGETAVQQSWSWIVSVRSHGEHICGGSVLSPSYIITAAHCIKDTHNFKSITILAGSLTLKPSSNDLSQIRSITKVYKHPDYNSHSLINDLVLLRLSSPLNMIYGNIKAICLPSGTVPQPPDNIDMIAIGWGTTSTWTDEFSSTLRQVTVQSIASTSNRCQRVISDSKLQFCAGVRTGNKDTCKGDGGGPLMAFVNNIWQLYGVTSYGYGCASPDYPGVYTRVSYYIKWIKSIMPFDEITTSTSNNPMTTITTTSKNPMETTTITSEEPMTTTTSERPITTITTTSEKPLETTATTSEESMTTITTTISGKPMETTTITSKEPMTDIPITSGKPTETTTIRSEEPMTTITTSSEEPMITTASTSKQPMTELLLQISNSDKYLRIQLLFFIFLLLIIISILTLLFFFFYYKPIKWPIEHYNRT